MNPNEGRKRLRTEERGRRLFEKRSAVRKQTRRHDSSLYVPTALRSRDPGNDRPVSGIAHTCNR